MTFSPESIDCDLIARVERAVEERGGKRTKRDTPFRCPYPERHAHRDRNPSATYSWSKKVWYCHACGQKGGVYDLARSLGIEPPSSGRGMPRAAARKCIGDGVMKVAVPHVGGSQEGGPGLETAEAVVTGPAPMEMRRAAEPEILSAPKRGSRVLTPYTYRSPDGVPIRRKVRIDEVGKKKSYRWEKPTEQGGWEPTSGDGNPGVLYAMPEVEEALRSGTPLFVVEGEKCADALLASGLPATCNPDGAGPNKWSPEYTAMVSGARELIILPDNDGVGMEHAEAIANALASVGTPVKLVSLSGLPEKGDVFDWLEQGHTAQDLLGLAEKVPPWTQDGSEGPSANASLVLRPGTELNDTWNAFRFVARHGLDLRFSHEQQLWRHWDGRRWDLDRDGSVPRMVLETQLSLEKLAEEAGRGRLPYAPGDLRKHAKASGGAQRLAAMQKIARSIPPVPLLVGDLDRDPMKLNLLNGTLDLASLKLSPHCREDMITRLAPVKWDPDAVCPRFDQFLMDITGGEDSLIRYVQRQVGYALTGSTREDAVFIWHGTGANGKSTLLGVLMALLGDYAAQADIESFLQNHGGRGVNNDIARLHGPRLVSTVEPEEGARLSESRIKSLTGRDRIVARYLFKEFFEFEPCFKLILVANRLPVVRGTDEGIWRRIHRVPFNVHIPDSRKDPNLREKLVEELPGILRWAVEGCQEWQRIGLDPPQEVLSATRSYREDSDHLAPFLAERCRLDADGWVGSGELLGQYNMWARENGYESMSARALADRLAEKGIKSSRTREKRGFSGLSWVTDVTGGDAIPEEVPTSDETDSSEPSLKSPSPCVTSVTAGKVGVEE